MRRHASADEIASYAAGDMRQRKAAKISAHLDDCPACRDLIRELEGVSSLLASVNVSFAPMPQQVSVRIEAVIATESVQRVAAEPATEADRRDLPARARRSWRLNWRLPDLSSGALRTVAATAAAVVVVGGGYELVTHGPGSSSSGQSPSSAGAPTRPNFGAAPRHAAPGTGTKASFGPDVTLTSAGHEVTVRTASTQTNFNPGQMQAQVSSAVTRAKNDGLIKTNDQAVNLPTGSPARDFNAPNEAKRAENLAHCIENVAGTRIPELIELARFRGTPSTIIVLAAVASHPAEVLVVGASCSAQVSDLLFHRVLKHL